MQSVIITSFCSTWLGPTQDVFLPKMWIAICLMISNSIYLPYSSPAPASLPWSNLSQKRILACRIYIYLEYTDIMHTYILYYSVHGYYYTWPIGCILISSPKKSLAQKMHTNPCTAILNHICKWRCKKSEIIRSQCRYLVHVLVLGLVALHSTTVINNGRCRVYLGSRHSTS